MDGSSSEDSTRLEEQRPTPTPGPPRGWRILGPDTGWHLSFGVLLGFTLVAFTVWSIGYVGGGANISILVVGILFGVFMAFNIGGNDVANSFGTSVGAGTLTMKQALMVAAVFEVAGALLAGGAVTDTVRSGIVDLSHVALDPLDFASIMMSALLGAAVWLLLATRMGWPVSTTHAIIGGIVGAAVTSGILTGAGGFSMVQWGQIGQIAISWVLSPVLGGLASFVLFGLIKRYLLAYKGKFGRRKTTMDEDEDEPPVHPDRFAELQQTSYAGSFPGEAEKRDARRRLVTWVPVIGSGAAVVIAAMLLFKGLSKLELGLSPLANIAIMVMVAVVSWMAIFTLAKSLQHQKLSRATFVLFSWMQVFTASAFAFSHGSNDIANAIGPFAAILDVLRTNAINAEAAVPTAALGAFGVALIAGLWFIGRNVIRTVGSGLTAMHPASGFAAELSAAAVVMLASVLGLPVSSTHILIGAVMGIGLVNRAANWKLMRPIGLAWVITLPAAALMSAVGVLLLRLIF